MTCQVLLCRHDPGLYGRLYPAGWCLVEDMETQHQDTLTSLASSLSGEDSRYTALTQLLIMFQVNSRKHLIYVLVRDYGVNTN